MCIRKLQGFQLFIFTAIDEKGDNGLHPREELESVVMEGEAAGVVAMSLSLDGEEIENAASMFESSCESMAGRRPEASEGTGLEGRGSSVSC